MVFIMIDEGQEIAGTIYISKDKKKIPDSIIISLKTRRERERGE
jgi:hypothetical protein